MATGSQRSLSKRRGTYPLETSDDSKDIIIAVMGSTGAGKSSFINLVSGSSFDVGEALESKTAVPQATRFDLFGRRVMIIDTPGFNDTTRSDAEILSVIGQYFSMLYSRGSKITAVIYLHRISDNRVAGSTLNNMKMCQAMCGDRAIENLIVCTTMWEQVSPEVGETREKELMGTEQFWGRMMRKGARHFRHLRTRESAESIIKTTFGFFPVTLRIQSELVDEKKLLLDTKAGALINAAIRELQVKRQADLAEVDAEYQRAIRQKDVVLQQELEADRQAHRNQLRQAERQQQLLGENLRLEELQRRVAMLESSQVDSSGLDIWAYMTAISTLLGALGQAVGGLQVGFAHISPQGGRRRYD